MGIRELQWAGEKVLKNRWEDDGENSVLESAGVDVILQRKQ